MTQAPVAFATTDWDAYAHCYDVLNTLRPYQELVECIHQQIPLDAPSVLDVGCGTGTLLQEVATTHRQARLVGVDQSAAMLSRAKDKLAGRAVLTQGFLDDIVSELGDGFSVVVSCNVLYATDCPLSFLRSLKACLASGGTFIVATPKKGFDNGLIIKAHCNDQRPDAFWQDPHQSVTRERFLVKEAFGNGQLAEAMLHVAYYNRKIAAEKTFHFFSDTELVALCAEAGLQVENLTLSYAKQTQVVTGHRKGE